MYRLAFLLAASIVLLPAQSTDQGKNEVLNGRAWVLLNTTEHLMYIAGYRQGVQWTASELAEAARRKLLDDSFPAGFNVVDFESEIDKLYAQAENLNISVPLGYRYVAEKLTGRKTMEQLEKDLIAIRAIAAPR